jgi:hypothetical protein
MALAWSAEWPGQVHAMVRPGSWRVGEEVEDRFGCPGERGAPFDPRSRPSRLFPMSCAVEQQERRDQVQQHDDGLARV